jgi:hypothetical protein
LSAKDPVDAISEADARGDVAELYADIRATLGVPVVNLVWRNLATIDGALPWAWSAVRPAYVSGAVDHHAGRLKAGIRLPALEAIPGEVLSCLGLAPAQQRSIRQVLDSYDRSNPMNWLALSALLLTTETDGPDAGAGAASEAPAGALADSGFDFTLPALPALDELDAATRALVLRLNALDAEHPDAILASMFRHLAHWPAVLALLWAQLAPLATDGRLRQARLEVSRQGGVEAQALSRLLRAQTRQSVQSAHTSGEAALRDFLARVGLPKMIAITTLLRNALGARPDV